MSARPEALESIGNYTIERSLAHGSMGHVYVAHHTLTHAQVALKVLRADLAADAQAEERFLREVRAAAHIGHDGIVKVHDAGRSSEGLLYLAMELLHGDTLEDRMARLQGERLALMDLIWHALEPLAAAHAHDIVHRDLKPANVFIACAPDGSERVKLLDFGLARDTREKSGTETGIALGTPYYMSPEQATRPKLVGPASDVWSIGVMMYEILSGYMPFEGETLHAVVIHSTTTAHVPLAQREPQLDRALCALVEACLQKDPALRPADATQLLERLGPLLHDEHLRAALAESVEIGPRDNGLEPLRLAHDAMPFADTAISLTPRLLDSEMRSIPRRSTRGWWISALALLLIAGAGFLLALQHADNEAADAPARTGKLGSPRPPPFQPVQPHAEAPSAVEAPARVDIQPAATIKEPIMHGTNAAPQTNPAVQASAASHANPSGPTQAAVLQPTAAQVNPVATVAVAPAPPAEGLPANTPSVAADPPPQQPTAAAPPASEAPVQSAPPEHAEPEPPAAMDPAGPPPDDLPPPEPAEPAPETPP